MCYSVQNKAENRLEETYERVNQFQTRNVSKGPNPHINECRVIDPFGNNTEQLMS